MSRKTQHRMPTHLFTRTQLPLATNVRSHIISLNVFPPKGKRSEVEAHRWPYFGCCQPCGNCQLRGCPRRTSKQAFKTADDTRFRRKISEDSTDVNNRDHQPNQTTVAQARLFYPIQAGAEMHSMLEG